MPYNPHPKSLQNLGTNGRGGRPKGVLNKRTRLLRQNLLDPDDRDLPTTPKQVLAVNMVFFQKKADDILQSIEKLLKAGAAPEEVEKRVEMACQFKLLANEAAAKPAPYVHPRLANVEVKTDQAQPFAVRVPTIVEDADEWARTVAQRPMKLIDANGGGGNGSSS